MLVSFRAYTRHFDLTSTGPTPSDDHPPPSTESGEFSVSTANRADFRADRQPEGQIVPKSSVSALFGATIKQGWPLPTREGAKAGRGPKYWRSTSADGGGS